MDLAALSDRSWERGRLSVEARLRRLRSKAWMIGQSSISAGVAWFVAHDIFGHSTPFFAPVATVICLGTSYGQRLRRVVEVSVGVSIGIGIADSFVHVAGRGNWQIVVVVALSMSAAIALNGGVLFVNQAAVQSIVATMLLPLDGGLSRIEDALIGGGVALLAATIVPGAPLRRPREEASRVTYELARLLRFAQASARDIDVEQASDALDRARETEDALNELRAAAKEGLEVVRSSPFRRRQGEHVRSIADVVGPLDRALRNTRVMLRRIVVSARLDETMPPDYLLILDGLAHAVERMGDEFAANRSPEVVQDELIGIAEATGTASEPLTLSSAVVLAQIRSLAVDLMELSGLSAGQAVEVVPPRT